MIIVLFLVFSLNAYSEIDILWEHLIKYEGKKLVREPDGEYSKFGIKATTANEYNKLYNKSFKVENLKEEEAKQIFEKLYYKRYNLEEIKNKKNKVAVMDTIYNQGIAGIILIQKSLIAIETNSEIIIDGIIGKQTIKSINEVDTIKFLKYLRNEREQYYRSRKNFNIYGKGWLRRLDEKSD